MTSLRETTLGTFLENVSSSAPTPGGGSVAAVVGALAASLGCMVAALTSKKNEQPHLQMLAAKYSQFRESFVQLCDEDQFAFNTVMSAFRLPKDDASRSDQIEAAVQTAARTPLAVAQCCVDLLADLESLVALSSRHAISDVGAAAHLALAALRASLLNVTINVTFMKDQARAETFEISAAKLESEGAARSQRVADQVVARIRG